MRCDYFLTALLSVLLLYLLFTTKPAFIMPNKCQLRPSKALDDLECWCYWYPLSAWCE
jgi:hypothetical protein